MWLFVGLGNPGEKYENNRHNIGFMAIDAIADQFSFPAFKSKFQGALAEGTIHGSKVILLKPQTYMNESGQSVGKISSFYKFDPSRIVIFHDELDLEPARLRVKIGGGVAGHNGLKSIQAHLGTPEFIRVRLGIGHPGDKDRVSDYVLSNFSKTEMGWAESLNKAIAGRVNYLLENRLDDFMSKVAIDMAPAAKQEG